MIKYFCDNCKKEIKNVYKAFDLTIENIDFTRKYKLCECCASELINTFKTGGDNN